MNPLSQAMPRPLPDRRRYEVQLSRGGLLSAGSALALGAILLYLGGLLVGSWLVSPAPGGTLGPGGGALAEPAASAGGGRPASIGLPWDSQAEPAAPDRFMIGGSSRLRFSTAHRHRTLAYHDPWFRSSDPEPLTPFGEQIYQASRRHRMSPQVVAAVVWAESAFDPRAVSAKGARGLMQVMPATAKRFGVGAERLFDPEANLDVGVRYLRFLSERYAGDVVMVLAAYNAGEGAVDQYRDVPPYPETRQFVRRVAALLEPRGAGRF